MTETDLMAADTWRAMLRGSLPPWAAIDRAQDVTGDRDAALQAILDAAVADFRGRKPKGNRWLLGQHAETILTAIRLRRLVEAETLRKRAILAAAGQARTANDWHDWYHDLRRGIRLCAELVAASSPAPSEAS